MNGRYKVIFPSYQKQYIAFDKNLVDLLKLRSNPFTGNIQKLLEKSTELEPEKVIVIKASATNEVNAVRDISYSELVEELNEQFEIVKANLDRIKNRFRYRMLINISYPLNQANKIEEELWKELNKINDQVSKMWSKIG